MHKLHLRKRLAFKFVLFSIVAVALPAATIAASLIYIGRKSLSEHLYTQQDSVADRLVDRISTHIEYVQKALAMGAREMQISRMPRKAQEAQLARLLDWENSFTEAFIVGPQGREIAKVRRGAFGSAALLNRGDRQEFVRAIKENRAILGEPFFAGDRMPYFFASYPLRDGESVLVARVSLLSLWSLVGKTPDGKEGSAFIVDSKGNLLAHPNIEKVRAHTNLSGLSVVSDLAQNRTGYPSFGKHVNELGESVVSMVKRVPNLNWGVVLEVPTRTADASIHAMERAVVKWTIVSCLLVLAFVLWRLRAMIRTLKILEEGARRITMGELNVRLNIHTGDELEHLAESFERMADSLKNSEQIRKDLISMLVHDLKSPLAAMVGGVEYVLENLNGELQESNKRILTLSKKSAEELGGMVQNLLDLARMEEGKLNLNSALNSMPRLLQESVEAFALQASREEKQIRLELGEDIPDLAFDYDLIRRVVVNLLSNALHFTHARGEIIVGAEVRPGLLEVFVSDNGEGIPPEYQEHIFRKYVQSPLQTQQRLRIGTGLGLTFCKMAVELHGGTIAVQSEVGSGSTFTFKIPLLSAGSIASGALNPSQN